MECDLTVALGHRPESTAAADRCEKFESQQKDGGSVVNSWYISNYSKPVTCQ